METRTMTRRKAPSFNPLTYSLWGVFALTIFSGIFLMVHYVPTFVQAFSSVERLNEEVSFGWMVRRLHAVGGNFLLLLILIHLLRVFYSGAYKIRPRLAWVLEALLFFLTVWTNFTGFFLPLSHSAFWGMAMTLSNFSTLPWIGNFIVEFFRGGKELGGTALVRFYSMHIGSSALIVLILFGHYRLGITERKTEESDPPGLNLWTAAAVALLLLAVATFASNWFTDSLKEAANPTINPDRISIPWYFLFLQETLSFFNIAYPVCSILLFLLILFLIFSLPYIDRNPEQSLLMRPASLAVGSALLVMAIYFTLLGTANARYGEKIIVPDKALSASEIRGAQVFAEKNCAYCHQVFGREGRREGPDMSVVKHQLRSRDWIQRFIHNSRLYRPGTTMPRYEIPLEDLEALSAYIFSFDSQKRNFKAVERTQFFDDGFYIETQGEEGK
jgi:ubiquinol-cytochrome c reductase cytochrome b subunit